MSKETLTPWTAFRHNVHESVIIDSNNKEIFTGLTDKKRINFLLQAVNNHDRLVEALEQVVADIHTGNYDFGEHMLDEWEQLLTELKQQ